MASLGDQIGVAVRGVQGNVARALRQFQPGGMTGSGSGIPLLRGKGIPGLPKLQLVLPKQAAPKLPSLHTPVTPGKYPAPHPRTSTTELALSRGFRQIRSTR